jgi:hypothetical protein
MAKWFIGDESTRTPSQVRPQSRLAFIKITLTSLSAALLNRPWQKTRVVPLDETT